MVNSPRKNPISLVDSAEQPTSPTQDEKGEIEASDSEACSPL